MLLTNLKPLQDYTYISKSSSIIGMHQQTEAIGAEDPTSSLYTVLQILLQTRFSRVIRTEHPLSMHVTKQSKVALTG